MQDPDIPEITPELLQQNPGLLFVLMLVTGVVVLGGVGSLASWAWIVYRLGMGTSVLPLAMPWRPRLWSFLDLVVVVGATIALQAILVGLTSEFTNLEEGDSPPLEVIAVGGLASLLGVAFGIFWIHFRYRQGASHIGLGSIGWKPLLASLVVGLAALPLIYLMMMVVTAVSRTQYKHPLIDSAADSGTLLSYLLGCFAAVIAAPIAEEFLFRVVLQGWLQSIPFKSKIDSLVGTLTAGSSTPSSVEASLSDKPYEPPDTHQVSDNPYDPPDTHHVPIDAGNVDEPISLGNQTLNPVPLPVPPIWPSIVAGVLFGLAHIEYGLSFIPLSAMGIVLGLVYRQTHSIWPCILIHAMLNALSMLMLGLIIMLMQTAG